MSTPEHDHLVAELARVTRERDEFADYAAAVNRDVVRLQVEVVRLRDELGDASALDEAEPGDERAVKRTIIEGGRDGRVREAPRRTPRRRRRHVRG